MCLNNTDKFIVVSTTITNITFALHGFHLMSFYKVQGTCGEHTTDHLIESKPCEFWVIAVPTLQWGFVLTNYGIQRTSSTSGV